MVFSTVPQKLTSIKNLDFTTPNIYNESILYQLSPEEYLRTGSISAITVGTYTTLSPDCTISRADITILRSVGLLMQMILHIWELPVRLLVSTFFHIVSIAP